MSAEAPFYSHMKFNVEKKTKDKKKVGLQYKRVMCRNAIYIYTNIRSLKKRHRLVSKNVKIRECYLNFCHSLTNGSLSH